MPYAVEILFTDDADKIVRRIWERLYERGITYMIDCGAAPHLTLAVYDDVRVDAYESDIGRFASTLTDLEMRFGALGVFPSSRTFFLAPTCTDELLAAHRDFHERFAAIGARATYLPGDWVPHCTLAMHVEEDQWPTVIEVGRREWARFVAGVGGVGLLKFEPGVGGELVHVQPVGR